MGFVLALRVAGYSSGVSMMSSAATAWSSCGIFDAPTIGAVTPGLREQPGQRDLRRRHAAACRDVGGAVGDAKSASA